MIAYLDASCLVKLFLEEDGSANAREIWDSDLTVSTARIGQVELVCALAAAVRSRRLTPEEMEPSVIDGTLLSNRAEIVEADEETVRVASTLGIRHGLRALDAIHVASALALAEADPVMVSWDDAQRRAAAAEGLPVYPE